MSFIREHSKILQIILIIAACGIIYAQSLQNGYVWDDDKYLYENDWVAYEGGLKDIWFSHKMPQYYPLVFTSFWIEHKIWEFKPFGYHLVNLILHMLNAILVFLLIRKLNPRLAFAVALLFAVHPVQVETVAWVTERKNLLSLFFFLLTVLSYLRYDISRRKGYYFLALILFVCALLSKSVAVCFVAVPVLYKWWKDGKVALREFLITIPFLTLGLISAVNTVYVEFHRVGARGVEWALTFLERLILAGRIAIFYLCKLCFPFKFAFIYPRWMVNVLEPWQWFSLFATLMILLGFYLYRRSIGRGAVTLFMFYLISIFPALGFINVFPMKFSYVADHFSYLSTPVMLLLVCSVVCFFLDNIQRRTPESKISLFRKSEWAIFSLIVVSLCVKSMILTRNYKDEFTLWQDIISKNQEAYIAYLNLGVEYGAKGNEKEAIRLFKETIRANPSDVNSYVNLTLAYTRSDQPRKVIIVGEKALMLGDDSALVHKRLAWSYYAVGQHDRAIKHSDRAQELGHKVQPELLEALKPYRQR